MDLIEFFIKKNNNGSKCKEIHLKKNHVELYDDIISYTNHLKDVAFKQKVWHYIFKIPTIPTCKNCGKELTFKRTLTEGYGKYCSLVCTNTCVDRINDIKTTNTERYGGIVPLSSDVIKEKVKQTNIKKTGFDNPFKNSELIKQRTFDKYGVDHISKLQTTKDKVKQTNTLRYGVTTPLILESSRKQVSDIKRSSFFVKYKDLKIIDYVGNNITILCDVCDSNYEINRSLLYFRFGENLNPCTTCNPINELRSIKENEICLFLDSLNIPYVRNDRGVLNGQELDIYIPEHNLAIEFNGLYYHSTIFKDKNYHLNKTELCEKSKIRLIQIFEDEWMFKQEHVKSRLKSLLGLSDVRIYGRKCELRYVDTKTKTTFLEQNHIQGSVGSSVNIGLYYNNVLVSLMTFGQKRRSMGNKNVNNGEYELLRFCNKLNHNVIGGASKLLKKFISEHKPTQIISYADRRWSVGNLYQKIGFDFIKKTEPNYFYIKNKKREYRFKYRKDILVKEGFDKTKSESQIMEERGFYKIYDCGHLLYSMDMTI
jgi:hypothetical protein